MTIYDVPVDDTEFFPVSGDMMQQMKHEEQQAEIRRRDNAIRQNMPPHRAEHLIRLLNENGTGPSAKNDSDADDQINYQEDQIMTNPTCHADHGEDVRHHPVWCNPDECETDELDPTSVIHNTIIGGFLHALEGREVEVKLTQIDNDGEKNPLRIGVYGLDGELNIMELERLIRLLGVASLRFTEIGEA